MLWGCTCRGARRLARAKKLAGNKAGCAPAKINGPPWPVLPMDDIKKAVLAENAKKRSRKKKDKKDTMKSAFVGSTT